MANEAETGKIILVDTSFPKNISWVYNDETFSDIILQCNREKIHAHKVILATRCPYFRSVLVEDPKMSEFTINDVSVEVFKKIIRYIYTGSCSLQSSDIALILEVMRLASRFSLKNLEFKISEEISSSIDLENVLDLLSEANIYDMEGLRNKCYTFIDERPLEILQNDSIKTLTQKSMVSLLKRDSLCVPEIEIFKSVQKWCKVNKDTHNLVVNCVRLHLLTNDEILKIVFPSELIENKKLLEIMALSENQKSKLPARDCPLNENVNLACVKHGAQVISGENTSLLLSEILDNDNVDILEKCAFHSFGDKNGITIKLKKPVRANHIQIRLLDVNVVFSSYYIEASHNQKTWQKVIDYSGCDCHSYQNLYFDEILVQYLRIVGTLRTQHPSTMRYRRVPYTVSAKKDFRLISFKLYRKNNTPKIRNGIVCPKNSIISSGSVFFKRENDSIWYPIEEIGEFSNLNVIVIHLGQPYWISDIKLRRVNNGLYSIETSLDGVNWQSVRNNTNNYQNTQSSWQKFVFEERYVVYIKILSQNTYYNNYGAVRFNRGDFEIPSND